MKRTIPAYLIFIIFITNVVYSFNLKKPKIFLRKGFLSVSLSSGKAIPFKVLSAIEDGIKIKIIYQLRFKRYIDFFLASDATVMVKNYFYTVNLNFLENKYIVYESKSNTKKRFDSRLELIKQITKYMHLPFYEFSKLKYNQKYYLESRVRIRSIKMYPPFNFLSILSYDTKWIRSEFINR